MLTASDTFMIAGCPFIIGVVPHPCVTVQWVQPAAQSTWRQPDADRGERRPVPGRDPGAAGPGDDHHHPAASQGQLRREHGPHRLRLPVPIDPVSGQAAQAPYAAHVDQMIRQVLLTTPASAPTCRSSAAACASCCSRPTRDALQATTQLLVQQQPQSVARRPDQRADGHGHAGPGRRLSRRSSCRSPTCCWRRSPCSRPRSW